MKVIKLRVKDKDGNIKELNDILIERDKGLVEEVRKRDSNKQVSILSSRVRKLIDNDKIDGICTGRFYENITIEDLDINSLSVGTKLEIGDTIQEISSVGKKCFIECGLVKDNKKCKLAKEAIFTRVLKGGTISKNDKVNIKNKAKYQ